MKFYVMMIWSKRWLEWRQLLVENSYHLMEKLQVQMKNYTIDYEEYFNRRLNWCEQTIANNNAENFQRNVWENWYCDIFTDFGNKNQWFGSYLTDEHHLYSCSSINQENVPTHKNQVYMSSTNLRNWSGCFKDASMVNQKQSFWQYKKNFFDVNDDADTVTWSVWDDDDEDLWIWPIAIWDNKKTQELYLISKDKQKRIFIRRALISTWDFNGSWWADKDSEKRYTLQVLRLKWFDIWSDHNLGNDTNTWAYDWQIDTWACDYSDGFICNWSNIWLIYSGYHLPNDIQDWRVNLLAWNITLNKRNLEIYPTSDPSLSWQNKDMQINPFIKIWFQSKLYGKDWFTTLPNVDAYTFSLQTTFDIKTFY